MRISNLHRTSNEIDQQYRRSRTQPHDILLSIRGTTGEVAIVPPELPVSNITQDTARIRVNSRIDRSYLAQALCSDVVQSQIRDRTIGQAVKGINIGCVRKLKIPFPSLREQVAIAWLLSSWDRGVRRLDELIAAKFRLKQGLMQQLLTGKQRFQQFTDPWVAKSLGSFLKESRIRGSNGAEATKLTIRLYGRGICPKSDTRPGSEATQFYKRRAGQFIYSKLDFLNGAFGVVPPSLDGYETSLDLPAFDVEESINPRWLLYFMTRPGFYRNQLGLAHGGRKARRVNPTELLKLSVLIPEAREQAHIADALETLDREIDLLRKQLDALKKQKKGLMQKLLTGQVRVKLPEGGT